MLKSRIDAKIGNFYRIFANDMEFMVKTWVKCILCVVAVVATATIMPAQDLPVLPADKAVMTGKLPNGTDYYIVSNPVLKGVADFALVQKVGTGNISDTASCRAVAVARDALSLLPRTGGMSVQEYFTSHGVTPGKEGFVKVTDDATEYRFSNVMLSKPEVLDSTLLVILDMVDRVSTTDDPFIRKWYAPSDQAVIVSGDVDASSVAEKLKMMSYMTPAVSSSPRVEYEWNPTDSAVFVKVPSASDGLASLMVRWNSSRTPKEYMNTIQPVIYEMYLAELGMIVEERLADAFRLKDIPFADVSCTHLTSLQSSADESFSVSVSVSENDFEEAVRTVAEVLGDIDAGKTDVRDLARMRRVCEDNVRDRSFKTYLSNSEYVDRCVTAFLYNGSLSSLKTKVDFLTGRSLADTTELRLFNNIASALLDPESNLTVSYSSGMERDSVRSAFMSSWTKGVQVGDPVRFTVADIPSYEHEGPKIKVRTEKSDHISKGVEWTFSNGFKVVYRRMPANDKLHYNLALNGGFGTLEDLAKGEGGYISDYFTLSRIGDVPYDDFMRILAAEGMSMDAYVGLNYLMVSGSVGEDDVDLLLNALLAVMNCRSMDPDAVKYYESGESLRSGLRKGTAAEMVVKINEVMCPDYRYVSHKMLDSLPENLAAKAEGLFGSVSSRTNDGVLVILGDVDEAVIRKKLLSYVGGFRTSDKAFRRPLVRYQPASGWSTYTVDGDRNSVDIALSVPMALTADNYMTAEIAAMVLRKSLSEAVVGTGMCLTLSHECRIYPNERINFHISLNEASPDGFASDVDLSGPMEALAIIRSVLSGVSGAEVSKQDVEAFKVQLKGMMKEEMKEPFYWLNVISRRHLAGKDFTTSHEERINAVTVEKVKEMLSEIGNGTRVEYIVSGK